MNPKLTQPEPVKYLRLDMEISIPYSDVLKGLDAWYALGLISEVDFRWRSTGRSANRLTIVAIENERILEGLKLWLELGLVSDQQVRLIGTSRLNCEITAPVFESTIPQRKPEIISGSRLARSPVAETSAVKPQIKPQNKPEIAKEPSKVAQTLRSLFSEFSTMWLLFLGVFLVVVSSGLLAASQWNNFPAQGQYFLLLSYTLGFFGVGFWTSKNERLRLTTRALQLVTLLLVPANFWAMDGLGLFTNPTGIGLGAIAGCLLSAIAIFLLQTSFVFQESQALLEEDPAQNIAKSKSKKRIQRQLSQLSIFTILLLSWLHLGWMLSRYYPFIAVYLGIAAIATSTFLNRQRSLNTADSSTFPLALITGAYSTILLISRALLFGDVSVFKLGLAFGICGWVLIQITNKAERLRSPSAIVNTTANPNIENPSASSFQLGLGKILLGLGWFVSVWDQYPWQTFSISLLIAWLLCDRLSRLKKPIDLTYLFFWGLQILWLGERLIPEAWRIDSTQKILNFLQTSSENSLLGIFLFPYLILALIIGANYRDRQKNALAMRAELLALGFGVLLNSLTYPHIFPIFINLSLSAITLLIIQARRSPNSPDLSSLVYFSHIISLSAIGSGVFFFTRSTSIFGWVGGLLIAMLIEWSAVLAIGKFSGEPLANKPRLQAWRDSAWHIGATLSALSYILLWNEAIASQNTRNSEMLINTSLWGVAWLAVPISLTFLGTWREFADRDLAIKLSIAGLAIAQFLTWNGDSSRIIGLGVAYGLMLVNTRRSELLLTTFNTVGYGLLFIASLLWQFKLGSGAIAQLTFGINGAVVSVLILYVLNHWLKYRRDRQVPNLNLSLNQSYSQAFDIWAAMLSTALLILQTVLAAFTFAFNGDSQLFANLLPSTALVALGLIYRVWQSGKVPPFWTEWGIAWSIELLTSGAIAITNGSAIELAIANLALGFTSQLLGDWWMQRTGDSANGTMDKGEYPRSWHIIPLIYGGLGSLLRIGSFSNLSGLFSLSTSLIGIGIGRRASQSNPIFKVLTYLSMVVATFSAYELLFYQMVANSQGGSLGDGMVILATLGCAIAYAYGIFTNWIRAYLRLSIKEIGISAHLHWTASAIFLILGSFFNPSLNGGAIGSGLAIALTAYAINQGRRSPLAPLVKGGKEDLVPFEKGGNNKQVPLYKGDLGGSDLWIYTGIFTTTGAIAYLLWFAFPNHWLIANVITPYAAAIACLIAGVLYLPPWEEWDWNEEPWHNSAFSLPLIFALITSSAIALPCLIITGIFYIIYAQVNQQIRVTYISLLLWNWAIFQNLPISLYDSARFNFLIYTGAIGLSGLYFAQVEPTLRSHNSKDLRHALRSLLGGGMSLIAFLYSFSNPTIAFSTWILSSVFIMAGLGFRVRAYLFTGTLTFILLVLTQAVILVTQYSFLMWALGIFAGIGFILVAANFEVRRDRILALFRNVEIELQSWE